MPLNKIAFKQGLKALRADMRSRETDPEQAAADYDDTFADLLVALLTSATVTGTVTTTGTAATQAGPLLNGQLL